MPKNSIFYFSGTGNSLTVAKSVAKELKEATLVPILREGALDSIDQTTEKIGLVFPIHMNSVPHVVASFIEKMKVPSSVYFFVIVTHGGIPGMTGLYVNKLLKSRGIRLDGYFEVKMINNTPKGVAPKMLMNLNWERTITPEKIAQALSESKLWIGNVVTLIKNQEKTTLQLVPSGTKRIAYWMMSLMWYVSKKSRPKLQFLLDKESCIGCETCVRICTTKRIRMNGNKPEWFHEECNFCYACFNYCPNQAIGVEHYTKKLGRYHHPEISVEDIAQQAK